MGKVEATKRIAEELSVKLETTGLHDGYVREAGDVTHVRWDTMYNRLYQRNKRKKKRESKETFCFCFDIYTNRLLGYSSVMPIKGEEHYFGDILFVCVEANGEGKVAVFEALTGGSTV